MLDTISDPDTYRLANDLSAVNLISYPIKDRVLTQNLDRYNRASLLLNEIEGSLRLEHTDKPTILNTFCDVLKRQDNQYLSTIAQLMLDELNSGRSRIIHTIIMLVDGMLSRYIADFVIVITAKKTYTIQLVFESPLRYFQHNNVIFC